MQWRALYEGIDALTRLKRLELERNTASATRDRVRLQQLEEEVSVLKQSLCGRLGVKNMYTLVEATEAGILATRRLRDLGGTKKADGVHAVALQGDSSSARLKYVHILNEVKYHICRSAGTGRVFEKVTGDYILAMIAENLSLVEKEWLEVLHYAPVEERAEDLLEPYGRESWNWTSIASVIVVSLAALSLIGVKL